MQVKIIFGLFLSLFVSYGFAQGGADTLRTMPSPDTVSVQDTLVPDNSEKIDEIVLFAKKFLGVPYRYAGTSPTGFDCSGFIYYVMGHFGFQLTRTSYGMAELGETVKLSELQPGDLLFFKGRNLNSTKVGHVAMVIEVTPDAINFIHASTSRGITIDNFKTSKYYISRFLKAKRMNLGTDSEFLIR